MKIGRPPIPSRSFMLAESYLFSSNVDETEHDEYDVAATYVEGDRVQRVSPSAAVTISNGNPAVIDWPNHGLAENTLIELATDGALPSGLRAGQAYFAVNTRQGTFNLALESDGTGVATTTDGSGTHTANATRHDIFEALEPTAEVTGGISGTTLSVTAATTETLTVGTVIAGSNVAAGTYVTAMGTGEGGVGTYTVSESQSVTSTTITGNAPVTVKSHWGRVTATNKWRAFDVSVSSQSSRAESMTFELRPPGRYDKLFLDNINIADGEVVIRDSDGVVQFEYTFDGVAQNWDVSHYSWRFEPIVRKKYLLIEGIPNIASPRITVTLNNPGGTALCGLCLPVLTRDCGPTSSRTRSGVRSYSQKSVDNYGNNTLEVGPYARRVSLNFYVDNTDVEAVSNLLNSYLNTPIFYMGEDGRPWTYGFGWFLDYNSEISYPLESLFSIDLESLT